MQVTTQRLAADAICCAEIVAVPSSLVRHVTLMAAACHRTMHGACATLAGRRPALPLGEHRLPDEVATEQHPIADLRLIERDRQILSAQARPGAHPDHEPKPGWITPMAGGIPGKAVSGPARGMGGELEIEDVAVAIERRPQPEPIALAGLNERRQLPQLPISEG